jgi:hypothetical protein
MDADEVFGRKTAKLGEGWWKVHASDLFADDPEVKPLPGATWPS